jgi:hypothetical protein
MVRASHILARAVCAVPSVPFPIHSPPRDHRGVAAWSPRTRRVQVAGGPVIVSAGPLSFLRLPTELREQIERVAPE